HEFTVTATAMGLSLNPVLVLLALVMGAQARPGRSTIQRWIQAAGHAAGRVLKHLDRRCQAWVLVGCRAEIFFHRRPVLVGVEPASMVWFLGQKAEDRTGATWSKALSDWTALSYVLADAGTGLQAGIAAVPQQRQKDARPALENGLDVFHTTQEAQRVLRLIWTRVERLWEQAEAASRRVEPAQLQGPEARGVAVVARSAWKEAEAAFRQYEHSEAGWKIAPAALQVFRPDGQLNDRSWARPQSALALPQLSGREWSKVRGFLQTDATWPFLDRLPRRLEEAEPEPEWRAELVRLWWQRRQRPRATAPGAVGGSGHVAHLVQQVVCHQTDANWLVSYRAVARVLRQTVRASSAVECMHSVIRMHQARHRTLTQGLLDRKRLYWNCREFPEGRRRGRCPSEHLGLKPPSYDVWGLLQGEMLTAIAEAKAKAKVKARAA
ncbi:MAG TPA: hypothetical protein VKP69_19070, partial [Isosphaeraceae bacterium]|nr:hypothetical protein [Isosphaeraceae bacterium]